MKVAIVGIGRMGRRHIEVVRNLGMMVVGLHDQMPENARTAQIDFGFPDDVLFDDFATLLHESKPDALVVATTAPTHCSYVCSAAEAGVKYILCEKPMAVSGAEAELMLATCERTGTRLAVNHQMRFMPQYTEIKRLAATAELGGLSSILVAAGNFGVAMNGSHYCEMLRYLTDEPVATVQAWFDSDKLPNPRGPQFEDRSGSIRMVTGSGRSMYMDLSCNAGHGLQVVYLCRYGQIVVDELNGYVRVIRRQDEHRSLPTTRYGMPCAEELLNIPPADLIAPTEAVWRGMLVNSAYPDGAAGAHAVRCLIAAHASNERGNIPIHLADPELDLGHVFPWA